MSLSAQAAGGVQKLCDFWQSVQDGLKEIFCIVKDLQVVSSILEDIEQGKSAERPYPRAIGTTQEAIESCWTSLAALDDLINELQPGFSSQKQVVRKWAALKAAWKGERIQKFRGSEGKSHCCWLSRILWSKLPCAPRFIVSFCVSDFRRRSFAIRDHQSQCNLEAIAYGMRLLLSQNTPTMTSKITPNHLDSRNHLHALGEECQIISTRTAKPVVGHGAQTMTDFRNQLIKQS